jgi:outer membrane immunogenic protein
MIRKFVAASLLALALPLGSALAADLPAIKGPPPPPPPPPPLWTGFYVGLNAGGTWSDSNSVTTSTIGAVNTGAAGALGIAHFNAATAGMFANIPTSTNGGFIGGGQVGYNWQFATNFVAGLEADIQGVAASSSSSSSVIQGTADPAFPNNPVVTVLTAQRRLDYLGTVRGRIGWLFSPTLLAYATGGLAYGGVSSRTAIFGAEVPPAGPNIGVWATEGSFSDTRVGWTVGGGLEWLFLPNWSAKLEYLYYDLGTVRYNVGAAFQIFPPATPYWVNYPQATTRFNGHIVRVGVNYHFNWAAPAPVVARY